MTCETLDGHRRARPCRGSRAAARRRAREDVLVGAPVAGVEHPAGPAVSAGDARMIDVAHPLPMVPALALTLSRPAPNVPPTINQTYDVLYLREWA
ncbi:hypothetical protein GCM10010199_65710 [Dactylosporangium roseum]